jgi:hypothetical protein
MAIELSPTRWQPGSAPVAVVMISLNEGRNRMAANGCIACGFTCLVQ